MARGARGTARMRERLLLIVALAVLAATSVAGVASAGPSIVGQREADVNIDLPGGAELPEVPRCANVVDDDRDGLTDLDDPGCASATDNSEYNAPPAGGDHRARRRRPARRPHPGRRYARHHDHPGRTDRRRQRRGRRRRSRRLQGRALGGGNNGNGKKDEDKGSAGWIDKDGSVDERDPEPRRSPTKTTGLSVADFVPRCRASRTS